MYFGVYGACWVYTKSTQNTPCITGVLLTLAFKERVKLVCFTSDVHLFLTMGIYGAEF